MKTATLLVFLSIGLFAHSQGLDIFQDHYDDNLNDWPAYSNDKKGFIIENGQYVFYSNQANTRSGVYKNLLVDRHQPFQVEASIKLVKGKKNDRYGLLIGYFNWDNYSVFEISPQKKYTIYQVRNGKRTYMAEERDLRAPLNQGYNLLALKKRDRGYQFYLNDQLVASFNDLNFIGTGFGYILNDKQEINADFIRIESQNLNVEIEPIVSGPLENLGNAINSAATEKGPIISADGKTMYFSLQGDRNLNLSNSGSDVFCSKLDINRNWTRRNALPGRVNNASHNFLVSIAPDENHAYFGNVYGRDGSMSKGLSEAYKVDGVWTLPTPATIHGFRNDFSQVNYCVANSGRVLLMAIENELSVGGLDLFVSFLQNDWTWSVPRNCGSMINTFANEMTPFLSADDKTLYFSSYGHKGFGSADIFMTRRLDDSWTNWSEPVNMGTPINGPSWDAYFKVDARGEYGYMVSTMKGGYGNEDIYRLQLADEIRPEEVVLIRGKVINSVTGQELTAKVYFEDLHANMLIGEGWAQKGSGYAITLPKGRMYGFQAHLDGYIPAFETIDLHELSAYKEVTVNLYVTPIKHEICFELNTVIFEGGNLSVTAYFELDRLAETLKANANLTIDLSSILPPQTSNAAQKGKMVLDYLQKKGANPGQMVLNAKAPVLPERVGKVLMKLK